MSDNLLSKLPLAEVGKEVYGDVLQPSAQQVGKAGEGLLKFVALPFKFLGLSAEQLELKYTEFIQRSANKLKPDIYQIPRAIIAAPLLDHVKFVFDEDGLAEMFSNLLASAMNKNIEKMVHPAFVEILRQMSPLDAEFLKKFFSDQDTKHKKDINWERGDKQTAFSIESLVRLGIIIQSGSMDEYEIFLVLTNFGIILRNLCLMEQSLLSEEILQMGIKGIRDNLFETHNLNIDLIFDVKFATILLTPEKEIQNIREGLSVSTDKSRNPAILVRICNMSSYSVTLTDTYLFLNNKRHIISSNEFPHIIGDRNYFNVIFTEKHNSFLKDIDTKKSKIIVKTESTEYEIPIPIEVSREINMLRKLKRKK